MSYLCIEKSRIISRNTKTLLCKEDGVVEDVARLGCRNWKVVTLDREEWRKLLKEAEAHPRL
jgi:hypothetical protein